MILFCLVLRGYSLQPKKDDQFEVNEEGAAIVKRTAEDNTDVVIVCTIGNSTVPTNCIEDTSGMTGGTVNDSCNKPDGKLLNM